MQTDDILWYLAVDSTHPFGLRPSGFFYCWNPISDDLRDPASCGYDGFTQFLKTILLSLTSTLEVS